MMRSVKNAPSQSEYSFDMWCDFIIDNHIVGGKYVTSGKEQAL